MTRSDLASLRASFSWLEAARDSRAERASRHLPLSGVEFLLNRVRRELHAVLDARLASDKVLFPLELTSAQLVVIETLAPEGTVCLTDLCERMAYDAGAMTRMLDRLEAKGVIRRRRGAKDRRVVYAELTEEGRARLPRVRQISMEILDQFLRGFSRAEVRLLENYLARLLLNAHSPVGVSDTTYRIVFEILASDS